MAALRQSDPGFETLAAGPASRVSPDHEHSLMPVPAPPKSRSARALNPAASDFLAASLSSFHETETSQPVADTCDPTVVAAPRQGWGRALALSAAAWAGAAAAIIAVGGLTGGVLAAFAFFGLPASWMGWQLFQDREESPTR